MLIHSTENSDLTSFYPSCATLSFSFFLLLSLRLNVVTLTSRITELVDTKFSRSRCDFPPLHPPWACGSSEKKRWEIQCGPQSQSREVWISLMTHLRNFVVARACRGGSAKADGNTRGVQLRPQVMLYYVSLALAVSTPLAITVFIPLRDSRGCICLFASSPAILCTLSLARPISPEPERDGDVRWRSRKALAAREEYFSQRIPHPLRISVHFSRTFFHKELPRALRASRYRDTVIIVFTESQDGFSFDSAKRFLARANYMPNYIPIARYAVANEGWAYKNHTR